MLQRQKKMHSHAFLHTSHKKLIYVFRSKKQRFTSTKLLFFFPQSQRFPTHQDESFQNGLFLSPTSIFKPTRSHNITQTPQITKSKPKASIYTYPHSHDKKTITISLLIPYHINASTINVLLQP